MNQDVLRNELNDVFVMLGAEEYPEIQEYLAELLSGEQAITKTPYEIAGELCSFAFKNPIPTIVADLIIELYEAEIADSNADAMNDLGALYYDGRLGEQDYGKAMQYYELAAKHGHRLAQENLGYCYYYGRDVAVDYEKAYHYFALGALSGMPVSLYKIGDMYKKGYYVAQNEITAFRIYEHCLDIMNDETAEIAAGPVYLRLGNAFLDGKGTEENPKVALICFQKAELYLRDMVERGNWMYKGSLTAAVSGQEKAREKMPF